ncbi:MAG: hypothetical protein GKR94_32260 [Gammaproteobacteria bacterium]|nr:hypothetical protein [Gammaproteobacteria bacterium]
MSAAITPAAEPAQLNYQAWRAQDIQVTDVSLAFYAYLDVAKLNPATGLGGAKHDLYVLIHRITDLAQDYGIQRPVSVVLKLHSDNATHPPLIQEQQSWQELQSWSADQDWHRGQFCLYVPNRPSPPDNSSAAGRLDEPELKDLSQLAPPPLVESEQQMDAREPAGVMQKLQKGYQGHL